MPQWVIDYVLIHELAHLVEAGHGAAFLRLVDRYPRTPEAKAYLQSWSDALAAQPEVDSAEPRPGDVHQNGD